MLALANFLHSPLARHPRLLGRKVASRLRLRGGNRLVPTPPVSAIMLPAHWAPALRAWLKDIPLDPPPHPFHRVFGQDFDENLLLQLCREGPRRGERGLPADIKLIWDYSRSHPLFTNAAAGPAQLDCCASFLRRWLDVNGHMTGGPWSSAMDVSIRAVNWIFADALFDGALGARLGAAEWAGWLWRHAFVVWEHLDGRLISSNHYLADVLGLLVVGSVFPNDPQARAWSHFARSEFPRALLAQTRCDGGLGEASLRYHAYVTEMALLFRLSQGGAFPQAAEARLRAMCQIVADFRDAGGDVFPIGDDDSGRVLAVDAAAADAGRADVLLRLAEAVLETRFKAAADAVYPVSGWWIRRAGDFTVALDFGGVGLCGVGAHAHNDDLSFCLECRGQPLIVDPGTCFYTGDPAARNRFRSTRFHNTLLVDDREQRTLGEELFQLPGHDEAYQTSPSNEDGRAFTRRIGDGILHRRELEVRPTQVIIRDMIKGTGQHQLEWNFHLHPTVVPLVTPRGLRCAVPHAGTVLFEASSAEHDVEVVPSEFSETYGRSQPGFAGRVRCQAALPLTVEWVISPLP